MLCIIILFTHTLVLLFLDKRHAVDHDQAVGVKEFGGGAHARREAARGKVFVEDLFHGGQVADVLQPHVDLDQAVNAQVELLEGFLHAIDRAAALAFEIVGKAAVQRQVNLAAGQHGGRIAEGGGETLNLRHGESPVNKIIEL